jgi:hypothetical protein
MLRDLRAVEGWFTIFTELLLRPVPTEVPLFLVSVCV